MTASEPALAVVPLGHPPAGSIVVGVDGSSSSDGAVDWAVDQARLERRPLTLLHALNMLGPGQTTLSGPSLVGPPEVADALTRAGRSVLADATRRARQRAPGLATYDVLSQADPRNALLSEAARAGMVVLGSRGRGPVASLLLGSVGVAVSRHADCPVVVVRPQDADVPRRGILVGVDGTALDRCALDLAFALASARAEPLTVLHCFWDAAHLGRAEQVVADDEPGLDDKRLLLQDAVRTATQQYPGVEVHLELARGFPDQRLVERSHVVDVVVVGSHRPGFSLGFGSIAPTVVEHAACAVAIAPFSR